MGFPNAIYCNGAVAPIDEVDTIQKHPLGTRITLEDGRVFAYARCGVAITRLDLGLKNGLPQGVANRAVAAAVAKGLKSVTLTTVSPDGAAATGTIVANEFEGGYIQFFPDVASAAVQRPQTRRVISNTGGAAGSIVFTFDRALTVALTTDATAEVMASPYRHVLHGSGAHMPVVGMATNFATAGQFLWVQTWGVCWLSPQSTVGIGGNTGLVFRHDGSLEEIKNDSATLKVADGTYSTTQYAGYILAETSSQGQAAPFFMLQLAI